jgi:hypothetical protein
MIKPITITGFYLTLLLSLVLISPGVSEAQFCRDEIACSTVTSMGSEGEIVLCQYFRSSIDALRGQVDYVYCHTVNDSQTRTCSRKAAQEMAPVTLLESEWTNEKVRCSKICGECLGGWKATNQP